MSAAVSIFDAPADGVLAKIEATTARFLQMNHELGGLFTQAQAALLLGCTRTRVAQYITEGRLRVHEFTVEHGDGGVDVVGRYVSGAEIARMVADGKRPMGRPSKLRMAAAALANK